MAETGHLTRPAVSGFSGPGRVTLLRIAILVALAAIWELVSASGLLYRDVVPSLLAIGEALFALLTTRVIACPLALSLGPLQFHQDFWMPEFYCHLGLTAREIGLALVMGGLSGLLVGLVLGANRFLGKAYESLLYYLGPTPKIIFFPIMIMWFGVGPASKVAMGAVSCFFPIALSAAAGVRQIDKVLIRVGKSFRANAWQTATKIYLPAMRQSIINGVRLGLGIALIGTLLAETKLSNFGVGFLIMQSYFLFDMPRMYATLIVLFVLAIGANVLISRLLKLEAIKQS